MSLTGTVALVIALLVALYGAGAAIAGARGRSGAVVESARTAAYSLFAIVAAANAVMVIAILRNDFGIRYVAENSSRETPLFFKVVSLWSADEGSLLLWNLVLAGYIAAVAFRFRRRRPETFPWALAVLYGIQAFYLVLMLGPTMPFAASAIAPRDGRGPLPLLQNHPLMAVHPPMLYLGLIGFAVPFAFAIAALLTGRLDDRWIRVTRRFTLAAWLFLTVGLVLGALWSYQVLGWGGYWAWDPVENVALLPWLTATAFLHSVMIEERRGMLGSWNLSLVVATFALTTLGTFLTRGDILSSVHSFAQSTVGPLYLGLLSVVLVGGFGLIAARSHLIRSETAFDTPLSREGVFLGNNLLLLALTFTVLLGTIYPLLAQATTGQQVSVGRPYFDRTTVPVMLLLLFLMAVGPLLPWRAGSRRQLVARLRGPLWTAAVVVAGLVGLGMRDASALLAYGLAGFAGAAAISELSRASRAFRRSKGGSLLRAAAGAASRNRRLFGGLIVHLGVILAAVAITTSASFQQRLEVTLTRGQTAAFAGYDVRFTGVGEVQQAYRRVVIANLELLRGGTVVTRLTPSLNFYPNASEAIGTPSIREGSPGNLFRDLYSTLVLVDAGESSATFRLYLNPGVTWLWIGGAVVALGGLLAIWPHRRVALPQPERARRDEELKAVGL